MISAERTSLCTEFFDDVSEESVCWHQDYEEIVKATMVGKVSHLASYVHSWFCCSF